MRISDWISDVCSSDLVGHRQVDSGELRDKRFGKDELDLRRGGDDGVGGWRGTAQFGVSLDGGSGKDRSRHGDGKSCFTKHRFLHRRRYCRHSYLRPAECNPHRKSVVKGKGG